MALDSARNFAKKFFEEDEFIIELYNRGGIQTAKNSDKEENNRKIIEVAKEIGYNFDVEEYKTANKEYFKNLGTWKTIKRIYHIGKVIKKAEKEVKK